jgi:hypothetical protein
MLATQKNWVVINNTDLFSSELVDFHCLPISGMFNMTASLTEYTKEQFMNQIFVIRACEK